MYMAQWSRHPPLSLEVGRSRLTSTMGWRQEEHPVNNVLHAPFKSLFNERTVRAQKWEKETHKHHWLGQEGHPVNSVLHAPIESFFNEGTVWAQKWEKKTLKSIKKYLRPDSGVGIFLLSSIIEVPSSLFPLCHYLINFWINPFSFLSPATALLLFLDGRNFLYLN